MICQPGASLFSSCETQLYVHVIEVPPVGPSGALHSDCVPLQMMLTSSGRLTVWLQESFSFLKHFQKILGNPLKCLDWCQITYPKWEYYAVLSGGSPDKKKKKEAWPKQDFSPFAPLAFPLATEVHFSSCWFLSWFQTSVFRLPLCHCWQISSNRARHPHPLILRTGFELGLKRVSGVSASPVFQCGTVTVVLLWWLRLPAPRTEQLLGVLSPSSVIQLLSLFWSKLVLTNRFNIYLSIGSAPIEYPDHHRFHKIRLLQSHPHVLSLP